MKILVVGGAGYIGSHVVREFLDAGYEVTVYDNLSSGKRENLFADAAFVHGDILDVPRLTETAQQGFDGIIHLAALKAAGESMEQPEIYSVNNLTGSVNIINAASKAGINSIVFSSSAAVYGEPEYLPIDENHPTNPMNYYGFNKLEIERILDWYDRIRGIRYAALRYFNAAGYDVQGRLSGLEEKPENLLPVVMETAAGIRPKMAVFGDTYDTRDGTCIRDYIHVSDLADAHLRAFEKIHKDDRSLTVNLGSETGVTVQEMIDTARSITGRTIPADMAPPRAGDPSVVLASAEYAKKLLGWKARHSDAQTLIQSTWNAYRKNYSLQ
ncbi:MAG: UDP-glucose 4-epimerase GalE [Fibrobacterota bacterium]